MQINARNDKYLFIDLATLIETMTETGWGRRRKYEFGMLRKLLLLMLVIMMSGEIWLHRLERGDDALNMTELCLTENDGVRQLRIELIDRVGVVHDGMKQASISLPIYTKVGKVTGPQWHRAFATWQSRSL